MRIDVTYDDGLIECHRTEGETSLSSDALSPTGKSSSNDRALASMLSLRLDLLESEGLRVDVWRWGTVVDADTRTVDGIPELTLEAGRIWRVVPPELMAKVVAIDVDGVRRVERQLGFLVDLTRFRDARRMWVGSGSGGSVIDQVVALHERIRAARPEWDDGRICEEYGYPVEAYRAIASAQRSGGDDGQEADVRALVEGYLAEHPDAIATDVMDALGLTSEEVSEVWRKVRGKPSIDAPNSPRDDSVGRGLGLVPLESM